MHFLCLYTHCDYDDNADYDDDADGNADVC